MFPTLIRYNEIMLIGMPEAGRRLGVSADSARRALLGDNVPLVHINARAVAVEEADLEAFMRYRETYNGKGRRPLEEPPAELAAFSKHRNYDDCRWRQVGPELTPFGQKWDFTYFEAEDAWQFNEVKLIRVKDADAPHEGKYYVGKWNWPFDENDVCYWLLTGKEDSK